VKTDVTYSELRTWRRCPWKASLEYQRRLSPIVKSPGFREGSIMDAGLNALYEEHKRSETHNLDVMLAAMDCAADQEEARIAVLTTLFEEEWAAIREKTALLRDVAAQYVTWAQIVDAGLRVITTQYDGRTPVLAPSGHASTKYDYRFKADGLVVSGGELWLLENKAWKTIDRPSLKLLALDEQSSMYLWGVRQQIDRGEAPRAVMDAFEEYGYPAGVVFNVLRKKIPTIPKQLKDGTTSRDKAIDTTEEVYRQTLAQRGQDPADYAEILDLLREKGNTFFYRTAIYRNASELAEIGHRIWSAARYKAEGYTFKSVGRECAQCAYFPLCVEYSDDLVTTQYRVRDRRHEEYKEEVEEAA
jgi:hypothetical protein